MSYSFTDGWDIFNTPFSSTPIRQAPSKQQAERTQQKASEAAQRNCPSAQEQKTPSFSHPTTGVQQKQSDTQKPKPAPTATTAPVPNETPALEAPAPAQTETTRQKQTAPPKSSVPASAQPAEPQKELVLDMSSGCGAGSNGKSDNKDNAEKRKAHEASEAKRKAEWEAAQQAKKRAEAEVVLKLQNMSDADIIAASTQRISLDVERITRRNMKECVSDHIQDLCRKDPAFARLIMHPRKNMINCFKYINRKAKEFIQQEMKDNDTKPENGIYGCDVPDGLVYQWSADYFHNTDAPEDAEKEEKFVPKQYVNTQLKAKGAASKTKKPAKTKKKEEKQTESGNYEQMSFV